MPSALSQIRQVDYTVIFTRDMAAMRRFYETTMEFPLLRVLSERWVEYLVGANTLALSAPGRFGDPPAAPGRRRCNLPSVSRRPRSRRAPPPSRKGASSWSRRSPTMRSAIARSSSATPTAT